MKLSQEPDVHPHHVLGSEARVLLTSVFGPYAQDDAFGSRAINPMELYHNQVTRLQGAFSLRMFHRSWGLMLIQSNIDAPCTLLDFPSRERFIEELRANRYDIVGIGSITANYLKVEEMCRLVRRYQPEATLVLGGHVANMPGLQEHTGADHVVRGEGVRWFRRFLGEDENRSIQHPRIYSGCGARMMGVKLRERPGDVAAALIPSVGCPIGCNFCATSAMFGGKGKAIHFYETGDELFAVMQDLERDLQVRSFFVMDENFLLHRTRALRLLELMRQHNKAWALYVFSSARVLSSYAIEDLVGLGVSWVWMGLEGENSQYGKLKGVETHQLVRTLQSHGICVLGSSIVGLDEHTPENLDDVIEYAVSHDADFHQFMLYTPVAGTPLFKEMEARGTLLDPECREAFDTHGQLRFAHRHPHIPAGAETQFLLNAFARDFAVNGPSFVRLVRTLLRGYIRHGHDADLRVRARFAHEAGNLRGSYAAGVWAAARWYAKEPAMHKMIVAVLHNIYKHLGWRARLAAWVMGPVVYHRLCKEQQGLRRGRTYEPQTCCEKSNQPLESDTPDRKTQTVRARPQPGITASELPRKPIPQP